MLFSGIILIVLNYILINFFSLNFYVALVLSSLYSLYVLYELESNDANHIKLKKNIKDSEKLLKKKPSVKVYLRFSALGVIAYVLLEPFYLYIPLPLLPLVINCLFIFLFKRWLGPIGTLLTSVCLISSVISFLLIELLNAMVFSFYSNIDLGRWLFCLDIIDIDLAFCSDKLALTASILVLFLTIFALYFGTEYMYRESFINRLLYLLNLFATSVVFLFFCYDYFLILLSWEFIGLFSLLLVNFYSTRVYTIKAALKTFVFSRISDMFMFLSFILTINIFNSTDLSSIFSEIPFVIFYFLWFGNNSIHAISLLTFCLVTSGAIKAAQFFFHVWLPDAMEAPTPASALIHSSTLVIAGVFLIIRFSILFEFTNDLNYYMAIVGSLTLSLGSITAVFQNDIKKLVAYSTISQIGYLVCGCGFGCYEEVLTYLIMHALNKAFLFVLVGYIVHFFDGNTDMRQMGGAYLYSFDVAALLLGAALNLSGLPYSAGFVSKEFLLFQSLRDDSLVIFVGSCWLVSFFFTPIYMFMPLFVVMFGPKKGTISSYNFAWNENSQYILIDSIYNFSIYKPRINLRGDLSYIDDIIDNRDKYYKKSHSFYFLFLMNRYVFTSITSKLTSVILFNFWLLFFFFGESFLSLIFNFSTLFDVITSSSFSTIKHHLFFFLTTYNLFLMNSVNLYIFFFTLSAFSYLILLNSSSFYRYFSINSFYVLTLNNFWVIAFVTLLII